MTVDNLLHCIGTSLNKDLDALRSIAADAWQYAITAWSEVGEFTRLFIAELGETVGVFLGALLGEEIAAAILGVVGAAEIVEFLDIMLRCGPYLVS
jgi:hypothetical protein